MISACTWQKNYESSDKQISLISIETEVVSIQIVDSSNENAQQLKGKFTIQWLSGPRQ